MLGAVPAAAKSGERAVSFTRWADPAGFRAGSSSGVRLKDGELVLKEDLRRRRAYQETSCEVGSWTSPPVAPGFRFTELIASWSAQTPRNSWVEIRVRVTGKSTGRWMVMRSEERRVG